jgi:hypothetical protein
MLSSMLSTFSNIGFCFGLAIYWYMYGGNSQTSFFVLLLFLMEQSIYHVLVGIRDRKE